MLAFPQKSPQRIRQVDQGANHQTNIIYKMLISRPMFGGISLVLCFNAFRQSGEGPKSASQETNQFLAAFEVSWDFLTR